MTILCPRCPKCDSATLIAGLLPAICSNPECVVISWNPYVSAEANLSRETLIEVPVEFGGPDVA